MTTTITRNSRNKFKVVHVPWIEVRKVGDGFQADVFDPAWGKVWEGKLNGSADVAVALAKNACRQACGDIAPNVFTV